MAPITVPRELPTSVRRSAEAERRFGPFAATYFDAMWAGDPLADAYVADFATIGHGRGMKLLKLACQQGIDAVPDAPDSLRALFAQLEAVPDWVDLAKLDKAVEYVGRYTRQSGIVLGAASLVSGYANAAASRPLEMTGRYIENAGMRTIEVGSWLGSLAEPGGLVTGSRGFELTVRVRIIHALVRHALSAKPEWDLKAWGVPICQAFLAYTLVEFCLIPIRGMRAIGAPHLPHEETAAYERWRYLGYLLGIDPDVLPKNQAEQERLEEIYLLIRPPVDPYCQSLVASINSEFLIAEIEGLLPARLHSLAPKVVYGLERVFIGDEIADELGIPDTRVKHLIRRAGPVIGAVNGTLDRLPFTLGPRARRGAQYGESQEARLRGKYAVQHDLVDESPSGGRAHPARA